MTLLYTLINCKWCSKQYCTEHSSINIYKNKIVLFYAVKKIICHKQQPPRLPFLSYTLKLGSKDLKHFKMKQLVRLKCSWNVKKGRKHKRIGQAHAIFLPARHGHLPRKLGTSPLCATRRVQLPSICCTMHVWKRSPALWKNSVLLPCVTRIRYQVCFFFLVSSNGSLKRGLWWRGGGGTRQVEKTNEWETAIRLHTGKLARKWREGEGAHKHRQ